MTRSLALVLLLGCESEGETTGPSGPLVEAKLLDLQVGSGAFMIGGMHCDGTLRVEDRQGDRFTAPVAIDGIVLGFAVMGMAANAEVVPLFLPADDLGADDLLGGYTGVGTGLMAGAGIATQHLKNEAGVEFNTALFGLGIGVEVVFEAVTLSRLAEFEAVGEADSDDSADTADTADSDDTAGAAQ